MQALPQAPNDGCTAIRSLLQVWGHVIHNTQRPESTLKEKSNSVRNHAVREAVALGECLTGHVSIHDNPADISTKFIPGGQKYDHLVGLILYDLADHR